jgi:hypothetical protein
MKKPIKKFQNGGSVMDKPSKDMRDPSYRAKREREQALVGSTPAFLFDLLVEKLSREKPSDSEKKSGAVKMKKGGMVKKKTPVKARKK